MATETMDLVDLCPPEVHLSRLTFLGPISTRVNLNLNIPQSLTTRIPLITQGEASPNPNITDTKVTDTGDQATRNSNSTGRTGAITILLRRTVTTREGSANFLLSPECTTALHRISSKLMTTIRIKAISNLLLPVPTMEIKEVMEAETTTRLVVQVSSSLCNSVVEARK